MNDDPTLDERRTSALYHFDRHTPQYREQFATITRDMHEKCPVAWSDTYGGHWVAASSAAVFELARCPHVSNDHDIHGERRGYKGITIPTARRARCRGGMLEMDDPEALARTLRGRGYSTLDDCSQARPPRRGVGRSS
jgi:hypothetical protein